MSEALIFPVNETVCGAADAALLGVKGANLVEMASMGLPVPPAFIINTEIGQRVAAGADDISAQNSV